MLDLDAMGEGRELLEAAADEAGRTGEHVLAAQALNNLIWHARQWSDIEQVRRLIDRMHRAAEAAGFEMLARVDEPVAQAQLASVEGDLDGRSPTWTRLKLYSSAHSPWTERRWLAVFRAGWRWRRATSTTPPASPSTPTR